MEDFKYIKKIEIKGLWSKFDINWELNPDVNVLSGINGSGKSTILKLIFNLLNKNKTEVFGTDLVSILFNNKVIVSINNTYKNEFNKGLGIADSKYSNTLRRGITKYTGREIIIFDFIKSIDQQLLSSEVISKIANPEVKTELDFQLYELEKEYLNYQINLVKKLENTDKTKDEIFSKKKLFIKTLNDFFKETNKKIDDNSNGIAFLSNNKQISQYQLSSGEKQLIIILLKVLIQDEEPAILLMDEPEISLHTDWQKQLISVIRELNPNVQIILATHSPSIIMKGWLDKVTNVSQITNNIAK